MSIVNGFPIQTHPQGIVLKFWMRLFLLTVGSFPLTVELFDLQLTILAFLLTVGASLLTVLALLLAVGAFLLTVGKVCLIRALTDCKQRSSTVSS